MNGIDELSLTIYGFITGVGLLFVFAFLLSRAIPMDMPQDIMNGLGIAGGIGVVLLGFGIFSVIKLSKAQPNSARGM